MFATAYTDVEQCTYAVLAAIDLGAEGIDYGKGTAFMVSPGLLITAAHVLYVAGEYSRPRFPKLGVLWAPEVDAYSFESVDVLGQDIARDLALLRIPNQRHSHSVRFCTHQLSVGTACSYFGFLAERRVTGTGCPYIFRSRSEEGTIHSFVTERRITGQLVDYYRTDSVMYSGLSGCPGFTSTGEVFGLHVASEMVNGQRGLSRWVPVDDIRAFLAKFGVRT